MNSNTKRWIMRVMTLLFLIFINFFFSVFSVQAEVKPGEIFPIDEGPKLPDSLLIRLYDPFTFGRSESSQANVQDFKPMAREKVVLIVKKAKDLRANTTKVGHSGGIPVMLENDAVLSDVFTENLIHCFEIAGYEVIPFGQLEAAPMTDKEAPKAVIDSEIIHFWVFWSRNPAINYLASSVMFKVGLYEPKTNQGIWGEMFTGEGRTTTPIYFTKAKYERSLHSAYAEAMKKLYRTISGEKFRNLLRK